MPLPRRQWRRGKSKVKSSASAMSSYARTFCSACEIFFFCFIFFLRFWCCTSLDGDVTAEPIKFALCSARSIIRHRSSVLQSVLPSVQCYTACGVRTQKNSAPFCVRHSVRWVPRIGHSSRPICSDVNNKVSILISVSIAPKNEILKIWW